MRTIVSRKLLSILILSLSCLLPGIFVQAQAGACGPYCVDTNDFVATITSFRTSNTTSNVKIIDTTIRFQNKTNQQLILGYAINSGMSTDDQGNRLVVGGPNGFRGIGLVVAGTNFDPKFVISPGGYGDAQFELIAQGWPKIVGFTHQLDLTVNEINSYEGNQHVIGGEFPLHFQGLKNGSAGTSPGLGALTNAGAVGSCGLAGAQGAAGQASATVSGAASALSSFGSLFGKKKAAQKADQVSSAAAGCDPRVNNVASVAGGLVGAAAAANTQPAQPNAATAQAQQMVAAGTSTSAQQIAANANLHAAVQASAAQTQTDAQATSVAATNPGNLAATAFSKFKLSQLKKQQRAQQQTPHPTAPQQVASASAASLADPQQSSTRSNMTGANMQGAQLQEQANPDVVATAPSQAVSAGKYDIIGIHLGMPGKEAAAALRQHGLQMSPETIKYDVLSQPLIYGVKALNASMAHNANYQAGSEMVYIMLTMPPNQQVVSKVSRFLMFTKDTAPTSDGLVADLVKKYGKPSYDSHPANLYSTGTRELYWVDDAQGHRLNITQPDGSYSASVNNCRTMPTFAPSATSYPNDYNVAVDPTSVKLRLEQGYAENRAQAVMADCAAMTMIYARIIYGYPIGVTTPDVAGGLVVVIGSGPLDRTATEATRNYLIDAVKNRDAQRRQAAQKNKPAL